MEENMNSKIKILFIPAFPCHNKVSHAGGQTCNYYLSKFYNDTDFEVGFAVSSKNTNEDYIKMINQYNLAKNFSFVVKNNSIKRYYYFLKSRIESRIFPSLNAKWLITSSIYKNLVVNTAKKVGKIWYPDIVVLDWTQVNIWSCLIKEKLPKSKIIAFEQDVAFLGIERKYP